VLKGLLRSPLLKVTLIVTHQSKTVRYDPLVRRAIEFFKRIIRKIPFVYARFSNYGMSILAVQNKIPLIKVHKVNDSEVIDVLKKYHPDLIIMAHFGEILKKEVINLPSLGIVNFHLSLLPQYRGTDPVAAAIINMDLETGVTVHFIDDGIDTGDIILQKSCSINEWDTNVTLLRKLANLVEDMSFELAQKFQDGEITHYPQSREKGSYFNLKKMIFKTGRLNIDWTVSTRYIDALTRACAGRTLKPQTSLKGKQIEICSGSPDYSESDSEPLRHAGDIVRHSKAQFSIVTGDGKYLILEYNFVAVPKWQNFLYKKYWVPYKLRRMPSNMHLTNHHKV
jgi:methionyl-tRNA formyltransferase